MGKFETFAALHVPGTPLILFNVWDAGSAQAAARAGARAIATGSASVAAAHGVSDAEGLPLDLALANAARILGVVDLPVSIDFEGGYAVDEEPLARNMTALAATGAIGCNFEDQIVGGEGIHSLDVQAARIAAARDAVGSAFFLNARTDIFLRAKPDPTTAPRPRPRFSARMPMPKPAPAASSCPVSSISTCSHWSARNRRSR